MTDLHLDPAAAEAFRQRHPLRQVEAGGQAWAYLRAGRGGGIPVLFLPGVLGEAYDAAYLLAPLENEITFLAPTLPPVAKIVILGPTDAPPRLASGQGILAKVFPSAEWAEWIETHGAGILGSLLQPDEYRAAILRLAAL